MAIGTAAAIIGGSLLTAGIGAASARSAANSQADATNRATDATLTAQREALAAQKPFLEGGYAATNRLLELLGIGGNTGAQGYGSLNQPFSFTQADLQASPSYQFQLQQGQEALDRRAAASGGFYSGANLKAAAGFNQDLAGTQFDRAFNVYQANRANTLNPLQALAGQGQTAANTTGSIQMGTGNALSNLYTGLGNAQGAAAISRGNAIGGAINNGLSAWQQASYLDKLGQSAAFPQWGAGGGFGSGTLGMGG